MEHLTNKDIMNGDWLIPQNRNIPDRVDIITFQREMSGEWDCITTKSDPNTHFYTGFCSQIPLSPEILEKNGFIVIFKDEFLTVYSQDIDDFQIEIKITNHIKLKIINILDCKVNIECEFVHKLQHAFKLCGITKEIEL